MFSGLSTDPFKAQLDRMSAAALQIGDLPPGMSIKHHNELAREDTDSWQP